MKPLAYRIRPKSFHDIVGQDHLVGPKGVITKMLENKTLFSMILYGPAGCGKTSIAQIIESYYPLSSFSFNPSSLIVFLRSKMTSLFLISFIL